MRQTYEGSVSSSRLTPLTEFFLLFAVFTLIVWPKYGFFELGFLPKVSPFTLATLAAIIGIFLNVLKRRRNFPLVQIFRGNSFLISLFAAYFVVRFLSDFFGIDPSGGFYITVRELTYEASFFFIASLLCSYQGGRDKLLTVMTVAMVFVIVISFAELLIGSTVASILRPYFSGIDPALLKSLTASKSRDGSFRTQSTFDHPIVLGEYLDVMLPILFFLYRFNKTRNLRLLAAGLILPAYFVLYATGSRGALLGSFVVIGFWFFAGQLRKFTVTRLIFSMLMIGLAIPIVLSSEDYIQSLVKGRTAIERSSSDYRNLQWVRSGPWILRSPILGFGDNQGAKLGGLTNSEENVTTIDDYYLFTILQNGFLGLTLLAIILIVIPVQGLRGVRKYQLPSDSAFCVCLASIAVVIAFVQRIISISYGMTFIYIAAGMFAGLRIDRNEHPILESSSLEREVRS